MECAAAFLSAAISDLFIFISKDEERNTKISVNINASKSVPSDVNWSPATATTTDDEMSTMSDDDPQLGSSKQSKVPLTGVMIPSVVNGVGSDRACEREFDTTTEIHATQHLFEEQLPQSFQQLGSGEVDSTGKRYIEKTDQNCMELHIQEESVCQTSFDLTRHIAAVCIQSKVRGRSARSVSKNMKTRQNIAVVSVQTQIRRHIARSSRRRIRIRQHVAAVSIQSQLRGCIARSFLQQMGTRRHVPAVSLQSQIPRNVAREMTEQGRESICAPHKISKTLPIANPDSSSDESKEWKEKKCAESMEWVSPRESMAKINAGGRAKGLTNTQNDFRSMLSFWESMVIHNRQRRSDYQGGTTRSNSSLTRKTLHSVETNAKSKQHKALESASVVYIQCCFRRYMRRRLESDAVIRIQQQACVCFAVKNVSRMREADMKSRKRSVAHINGKEIQAFVKYYSDTRYGSPLTGVSITGTTPLAKEKVSFFEPSRNPATHKARPESNATNTITQGIEQEDFWRIQRVTLQHR